MSAPLEPPAGRIPSRDEISPRLLEQLGDPEPATSSGHLAAAMGHADLESRYPLWIRSLLLSARPGFGAHCLCDIADRYHQIRRRPLPDACLTPLASLLGSSEFLARLLRRHAHWVELIASELPDPPEPCVIDPNWTSIRIAKYQGLLRVAARDLLGRPFEHGFAELSDLADRCLAAALQCSAREAETAEPALLALGKLGGRELNFSSDVDLLFLYFADDPAEDLRRNAEVTRLIQVFKRNLEVASEDGFAYRVDLDLRPEGRSGTLANSVEAALGYYESFGADWERQALLRLRHIAGPHDVSESFRQQVSPFVYRRGIDLSAIAKVREMKLRIEDERRRAGKDIELDLKEGPGGIRDVEFFVQTLQLLHGGRVPSTRTGNVLIALERLTEAKLLPEQSSSSLRESYLWLRRAEHALQLQEERQTQAFPRDREGQIALARRMGCATWSGEDARAQLLDDAARVRREVRTHFDSLILSSDDD